MFFSLQRRFLIFLLAPVVLILVVTGFSSFLYARSYLMNQWRSTADLRMQKAAHQIEMGLNLKRELIDSIAEAENTADEKAVQDFMIKKLMQQPGVRTVNIEPAKPDEEAHPPGF